MNDDNNLLDYPPGFEDDTKDDINIDIQEESDHYDGFEPLQEPQDIRNLPHLSQHVHPPYVCPRKAEAQKNNIEDGQIKLIGQRLQPLIKKLQDQSITQNTIQTARTYIESRVKQFYPYVEVRAFGGAVNGLSSYGGDVDCSIIVTRDVEQLEQKSAEYLLDNPQLMQTAGIFFPEYVHLLQQQQECENIIAEAMISRGEIGVVDQQLATKRDKWRRSIILVAMSSQFDKGDVTDYVLRARVAVLKLMLRIDRNTNKLVPQAEYLQMFMANNKQQPSHILSLQVDLCLNNLLPIANTELIGEYMKQNPITRSLILVIKEWANRREITQKADPAYLNSYALSILVIFYLQQTGALQNLQNTNSVNVVSGYNCAFQKVESDNSYQYQGDQLARHFLGFFHFYGYVFNFETSIISIRLGRALNRIEKQWYPQRGDISINFRPISHFIVNYVEEVSISEQNALIQLRQLLQQISKPIPVVIPNILNANCFICIEDPFEMNVNVTRTIDYNASKLIKCEFKRAFSVLKRHSQDPIEWLLLSPDADQPGQFPTKSFKQLKERQKEIDKGAEIVIVKNAAPKTPLKFSLTDSKVGDQ